jgi:hypothetical protein
MDIPELAEVKKRLERIGCPYCLNTRFSITLRCDLSPGGKCLLVGECQHCSAKFDVENVETFEEMAIRAERRFTSCRCECGAPTNLVFMCDLETENCYFAALCSRCGSRCQILPTVPHETRLARYSA